MFSSALYRARIGLVHSTGKVVLGLFPISNYDCENRIGVEWCASLLNHTLLISLWLLFSCMLSHGSLSFSTVRLIWAQRCRTGISLSTWPDQSLRYRAFREKCAAIDYTELRRFDSMCFFAIEPGTVPPYSTSMTRSSSLRTTLKIVICDYARNRIFVFTVIISISESIYNSVKPTTKSKYYYIRGSS